MGFRRSAKKAVFLLAVFAVMFEVALAAYIQEYKAEVCFDAEPLSRLPIAAGQDQWAEEGWRL